MSIFDDTPLEVGTSFWSYKIMDYNPDTQKYFVRNMAEDPKGIRGMDRWLSREKVEGWHGDSLLEGVETRQAKPGNSYNTRFFRNKTD